MRKTIDSLTTLFFLVVALFSSNSAFAEVRNLGQMATHLGVAFPTAGKIIVATLYVAGFGFGVATAYKFKQYKDNPTQIPIGTPIALLIVSVLMVFAPGLIMPAARTLFGSGNISDGFGVVSSTSYSGSGVGCLPGSEGC